VRNGSNIISIKMRGKRDTGRELLKHIKECGGGEGGERGERRGEWIALLRCAKKKVVHSVNTRGKHNVRTYLGNGPAELRQDGERRRKGNYKSRFE